MNHSRMEATMDREYTPLEKLCREGLREIQMAFRDPMTKEELDLYTHVLVNEEKINIDEWKKTVVRVRRLETFKTPPLSIIQRELQIVRKQALPVSEKKENEGMERGVEPWKVRQMIKDLGQKLGWEPR
jgi:hypothetical protein